MSFFNKISLSFLFAIITFALQSQYYTPAQIITVTSTNAAYEGDMYLDTVNDDYYIGLTNGILAKIGDTLDEKIDTIYQIGDSVVFIEGTDTFYVQISDADWYVASGSKSPTSINQSLYTNGSVGIGTNSPDKELHVAGELKVEGMSKGTKADSIVVWNTSDSTFYYLPIDSIQLQTANLFFAAEYAGATFDTINGASGAHWGNMTANNSGTPSFMNYYEWTSEETTNQNYDVILRFKVPNDFSSWGTNTIANQSETGASVSVQVRNITQGVNITPLTTVTNNAWTNTTLNLATLTTNAGDVIVIIITLNSANLNYARVGDIDLIYNR